MKHVKYKVDLSEWNIAALDDAATQLKTFLTSCIEEALQYIFEDDETYIYFPWEWSEFDGDGIGGGAVSNPLIMYLRVGMEGDGEKPTYQFNLSDVVDTFIEGGVSRDSMKITGGGIPKAKALAKELRGLAEKLESSCADGST